MISTTNKVCPLEEHLFRKIKLSMEITDRRLKDKIDVFIMLYFLSKRQLITKEFILKGI